MVTIATPTITPGPDPDPDLTLTEAGTGRPALILHGGGGPATVASIADHLAPTKHTLTHPGMTRLMVPELSAEAFGSRFSSPHQGV